MMMEIEQHDSLSRASGLTLFTAATAAGDAVAEIPAGPGRLIPHGLQRFFSSCCMTFGLLGLEIIVLATQLNGGTDAAMGALE